jgi:hypothetical protein
MKRYSWRVDIGDYAPLIGEEAMAHILAKAYRLPGLRMLHVSSTFYGDVPTMLFSENSSGSLPALIHQWPKRCYHAQ